MDAETLLLDVARAQAPDIIKTLKRCALGAPARAEARWAVPPPVAHAHAIVPLLERSVSHRSAIWTTADGAPREVRS